MAVRIVKYEKSLHREQMKCLLLKDLKNCVEKHIRNYSGKGNVTVVYQKGQNEHLRCFPSLQLNDPCFFRDIK